MTNQPQAPAFLGNPRIDRHSQMLQRLADRDYADELRKKADIDAQADADDATKRTLKHDQF